MLAATWRTWSVTSPCVSGWRATGFSIFCNPTFLTPTKNYEDQNQFLKFASLFIGSISLIAGYCWFGQQVIDESEKVQLAFYSTDWHSQTPGYKTLLPLAIMRASRPVTVKAGVFFDMSFLTLASLVSASYRFMTMLIQLNDS